MIEEKKSKEIFYEVTISAWYNTKLEHDKSLLILSGGAIGLLITFMMNFNFDLFSFILFVTANLSFTVCLFSILTIFFNNANYIENLINGDKEKNKNKNLLGILDKISIVSFASGVVLLFVLGIYISIQQYNFKGENMSEKNKKNTTEKVNESFNNANKLVINGKKSFDNAEELIINNSEESSDNNENNDNSDD